MNKDLVKDKIEYIVMFITEFSRKHHLSEPQAYRYLREYDAIDLIDKCYDVMHTQSFNDMVIDVTAFCRRKGGALH